MALVALKDVRKVHGDIVVLENITLAIEEGERVGLLGANGSGKSTLLRILAGIETDDGGERTVKRDLRMGYLPQEPEIDPALTVREAAGEGLSAHLETTKALDEVHHAISEPGLTPARLQALFDRQTKLEEQLDRMGGHDVGHQIEAILHVLGMEDLEAKCATLSGGERRRVGLARLLLAQPDLLLLDEPTNHLDAATIDRLEDLLLESRTPLVLVTHDRYVLDRVVDRILELDRKRLYSYDGGYGDYLVAKAERAQTDKRYSEMRASVLRRETAWMRRGPPAQRCKDKARVGRYLSLTAAEPVGAAQELELRIPSGPPLGTKGIILKGVTKRYGDRVVVPPMDLEIGPGTRLGIIGPNGAGKTTLLKMCLGLLAPDAGTVVMGPTVRTAFVDQQRTDLDPEKTVLEEIGGASEVVRLGDRLVRTESFLDQFLFSGSLQRTAVGRLSGGERNRVLLAKLLCAGGNVIALDEPTNDLDLPTLRALEEALVAFEGAVVVISHDRYFLDRVATRLIHMDGHGGIVHHVGNATDLLAKLAGRERAATSASARGKAAATPAPAPKAAPAASAAAPTATDARPLSGGEKRELSDLPEEIATAEAFLAQIDAQLADPGLYSRPQDAHERLVAERKTAEKKIARLYARWEALEARKSIVGK